MFLKGNGCTANVQISMVQPLHSPLPAQISDVSACSGWIQLSKPQCIYLFKFLFYIGLQLIYNVVLVSGVQQSNSVIHISILFQVLFPFKLLQNIKQSSLCYTIGPCWLSILYTVVCICQSQTPNLPLPATFPLW